MSAETGRTIIYVGILVVINICFIVFCVDKQTSDIKDHTSKQFDNYNHQFIQTNSERVINENNYDTLNTLKYALIHKRREQQDLFGKIEPHLTQLIVDIIDLMDKLRTDRSKTFSHETQELIKAVIKTHLQ